jgi:eukaryotic-like serine/threonine-protein kinase
MMSRDTKPTAPLGRSKSGIELKVTGDAALVQVGGLVDEHFAGFGAIAKTLKTLVIEVSGMTRMTSFGVRQWLKSMDALPKTLSDVYLLGCPTFFVDQLNMVLNFGGAAKILTVIAPYTCPSCGTESGESVDVLADRSLLAKGGVPEKECGRCGGKLEFDETPESYFSFVSKYAASVIHPAAAQMLSQLGLYNAADANDEKPPRIIKLVHGSVTYFRIIGNISGMFRARPFLVGAEGEVVLDLAEVERFDAAGLREWRRLLKTLAAQVPSVTVVDVTESLLLNAADSLTLARNIFSASVLLPYVCVDCGKVSTASHLLADSEWPIPLPERVCSICGGVTQSNLRPETLAPLQKTNRAVPEASAKLVTNRKEVLSRAIADASVAQAGDAASATLGSDDTILGKYEIVRRLSAGGMAEVFLAKQVGIGGFEKPVALKRILRQLLESRHLAVDMFLNEAKIAGRLTHPNIVQVLDVGEEKGALFLAMEYVRGKDLRDILKKLRTDGQTLPLALSCYIIKEIAQALHHAYWSTDIGGSQLAVVHRDVSPHNVMIGFDGTVKLLDFGVAMSSVTDHAESMIAGKWAYMSPESTANQPVDHRSDLFSVGVMFYLLCTGSMPFGGKEPREIVKKIRSGVYKPLEAVAPHVPPAIAELISALLAPKPDDRPEMGQHVVSALTEIMRSHGLEASAPDLAAVVAQLFESESHDAGRKSSERFAVGSGATATQADPHVTPSSRVFEQAGSNSAAFKRTPTGMGAPTGMGIGIDASVSLARRSGEVGVVKKLKSDSLPSAGQPDDDSVSVQVSVQPQRARKIPTASSGVAGRYLRILLIIAAVIAAAVGLFFLVNPT